MNVTCFAKDQFRPSLSTPTRRHCPCHACQVTAPTATKFRWSNSTFVVHRSGRSAPIWALSPCRRPCSPNELMGCSSMRVLPQKLPMQELARNIKGWSLAFSHVHWARQFKPSWSRQYMPPYIALRMIEVHREWTSNTSTDVATHELCCCWLLDGSELCLRCTGNRLQRSV